MTDEALINEARKITLLTNRQALFLIDWYIDQKDKEFGFREVQGFHEQLKMAISFYKETEREWQDCVLNDQTHLSFEAFLREKAQNEMIDLSDKLLKKLF